MKIITIAETTPGPVAINTATYIGYKRAGVLGSFLATFAVVLPAFIIIFVISIFFNNLLEIKVIANAFLGIKAGVAVLILFAGIKMLKQMQKNVFAVILLVLSIAAAFTINLLAVNFSAIYLILIGGALGFIAFLIANRKKLDATKNVDIKPENADNIEILEDKPIEKVKDVIEDDDKTEADK